VTIWADADSLPRPVRGLIARRAEAEAARHPGTRAIFVANRDPGDQRGRACAFMKVGPEPGAADQAIEDGVLPGDLVVTRDIPLAERLLARHGRAIGVINDRGGRFDPDSVRERRSLRDAMLELSLVGLKPAGRPGYGRRDSEAFARALDAELGRLARASVEEA